MLTFGEYLKSERIAKGMSITDLANSSTVSQPYLSQIESGKRKASIQIINKLAKVLEIDQFELAAKAGYYTKEELTQRKEIEKIEGERIQVNNSFRVSLKSMLEEALPHILNKKNEFIPDVIEDIKKIESKYIDIDEELSLTPEYIHDLISNVDWRQEWVFDLTVDIVNVSRKFIANGKNVIELTTFLKLPGITYKYLKLTDEEKETISKMLEVILRNRKEN